jgi:hypothetical protein
MPHEKVEIFDAEKVREEFFLKYFILGTIFTEFVSLIMSPVS